MTVIKGKKKEKKLRKKTKKVKKKCIFQIFFSFLKFKTKKKKFFEVVPPPFFFRQKIDKKNVEFVESGIKESIYNSTTSFFVDFFVEFVDFFF